MGTTDGNGNYSLPGTMNNSDVGQWIQTWAVGGVAAVPNPLIFTVYNPYGITTFTGIAFDYTRWVVEGFGYTSCDPVTAVYYLPASDTVLVGNGTTVADSGIEGGNSYVEAPANSGWQYYAQTSTYLVFLDITYQYNPQLEQYTYSYLDPLGYSLYGDNMPPVLINVTVWATIISVIVDVAEMLLPPATRSDPIGAPSCGTPVNAQISLYNGSTSISTGSSVPISASGSMPNLTAGIAHPSGEVLCGNASWQMVISYTGPDGVQYGNDSFTPNPQSMDANQSWNITQAFGTLTRGGSATISATYSGQQLSFPFTIIGTNPDPNIVKAALGTNPWFVQNIAKWESGYSQFNSSGLPFFGTPHGFGIMQLDPPGNSQNIWNWNNNVSVGVAQINWLSGDSQTWWQSQQSQFNSWNQQNQTNPVSPPQDDTEGSVVFSYSPSGVKKSFADAIAIKRYNGEPSGKNYIAWQNQGPYQNAPFWQFQRCETVIVQGVPQNSCYVQSVCSTVP